MFEERRQAARRVRRAAKLITRAAGLLAVSVLAGGCSLLPFGGGGGSSARPEPQAMRPALHEAKPNRQPDCIAEVAPADVATIEDGAPAAEGVPTAEPVASADVPVAAEAAAAGCTACKCKAADAASASALRADGPPPVLTDGRSIIGFTPATVPAADDTLQRLMDGNKRFVEGEPENIYRLPQRPGEQTRRPPAAMVLACSDWSIQPESAFDARAGELFVVSVAGNVADAAVIDSARYAVRQFEVPLIIVLGHEECGAVGGAGTGAGAADAEVQAVEGRTASGRVLDADGAPEAVPASAARAVHANVDEVVAHLRRADPVLSARIASGKLKVVGACYDETNGQIALEPEVSAAPETQVTAVSAE